MAKGGCDGLVDQSVTDWVDSCSYIRIDNWANGLGYVKRIGRGGQAMNTAPENYEPWDEEDYERERARLIELGIIVQDDGGDRDDYDYEGLADRIGW